MTNKSPLDYTKIWPIQTSFSGTSKYAILIFLKGSAMDEMDIPVIMTSYHCSALDQWLTIASQPEDINLLSNGMFALRIFHEKGTEKYSVLFFADLIFHYLVWTIFHEEKQPF